MFPTIRESAAVVSIILLLMLFLPFRLPSRYRRPIVVALLVVVLMLLLVPLHYCSSSKTSAGAFGLRPYIMLVLLAALFPTSDYFYNAAFTLRPLSIARNLG
jgi:hypothetical protein